MSQITLRGLPDQVEQEIRRRAAREQRSINQTILLLLQEALGIDAVGDRRRDLSHLAGTWDERDARQFDAAIAVFETIDPEVWQ